MFVVCVRLRLFVGVIHLLCVCIYIYIGYTLSARLRALERRAHVYNAPPVVDHEQAEILRGRGGPPDLLPIAVSILAVLVLPLARFNDVPVLAIIGLLEAVILE